MVKIAKTKLIIKSTIPMICLVGVKLEQFIKKNQFHQLSAHPVLRKEFKVSIARSSLFGLPR
jgi:hypothetical protein